MNRRDLVDGGAGPRTLGVLIAVGVAFLVLVGGGAAVFYGRARLLDLAVAWVVILVWTAAGLRSPSWRPRTRLWVGLLAVAAVFAASSALSVFPRLGWEYTGYALLLIALYGLLTSILRQPLIRERLLAAIPLLCVTVAVAYLLVVVTHWIDFWRIAGLTVPPLRPLDEALTYSNPSIAMAVAVLLLSNTFPVLTGRWRGQILVGLAILVGAVAFLTGSRGGALGLLTGSAAVALVAMAAHGRGLVARWRIDRRPRWALGAGLVGAAAVAAIFWPELVRRVTTGGGDLRLTFWDTAIRAFLERPVLGQGPGTWVIERIRFTQHPGSDVAIPHAHNIEIQALAEFGLVGLLVGIALTALVLQLVWQGLRDPRPDMRRWAYAALFGLAYLLGHQQVDVFANAPALIFLGALPVAVLDVGLPATRWPGPPRLVTAGLLVAIGAMAPWLAHGQATAIEFEDAVRAADRGDWAAAGPTFVRVAAEDPELAIHALNAGLANARSGNLAEAAEDFARAAAADDHPIAWVDLAAVQLRSGRPTDAATSLTRAFRLGRQHPQIAYAVGEVRLGLGDRAGAIEAFGAAVSRLPDLLRTDRWQHEASLADLAAEVAAVGIAEAPPANRWLVAATVGDMPAARAALDLLTGDELAAAGHFLDGSSDARQGFSALYAFAEANPTYHYGLAIAALAAAQTGDRDRVERYRRLATTFTQFGPLYGRTVRILTTHDGPAFYVNDTTLFYGVFTYGRPMVQDALVPWLSQLVRE